MNKIDWLNWLSYLDLEAFKTYGVIGETLPVVFAMKSKTPEIL